MNKIQWIGEEPRPFGEKTDGLGLDFQNKKHNALIGKVFNSPNSNDVWYAVDEFLCDRITYAEAVKIISKCKTLNNLEVFEFLDSYKEYKTFTP